MRLALTDLYRARWTDMIHDEWTRNVLKQRVDLARTRSLMHALVRDSFVTGLVHPQACDPRIVFSGHTR